MSHKSAETMGGSPVAFYLYGEDVDVAFKKALAAGAKAIVPVDDMFWGDRAGMLQDPFGLNWWIATHTRDLTEDQINAGAKAAYAQAQKK